MSRTILVVDDDAVVAQVLVRVLTRYGHTALAASDAAQGLRLARDHRPHLALLDLCLPDQSGLELARRLHAEQPDLPLILMTAYPLALHEHPELASGFFRVWTKPLDLAELRRAVEAVEPCTLNGRTLLP